MQAGQPAGKNRRPAPQRECLLWLKEFFLKISGVSAVPFYDHPYRFDDLFFPLPVKPDEPFLDLPEDDDLSTEQLDAQVQRAQDQLLALKRQQDLIEKQKRELEELSRRQDQLNQGKTEIVEKLTRAAVVLERELYDAQKRVETLREIQESFSQHYNILESINPKAWEGADLNKELNKALSAVDDARAEFSKAFPKIQIDAPAEVYQGEDDAAHSAEGGTHEFVYWLKSGFAFTLPIFILGLLGLVAFLLK